MTISGAYRRDDALTVSGTIKTSDGTNYSGVLDLGAIDSLGVRNEPFVLRVTLPAATTTHFPANTSCAFAFQSSDDSTFSTGVTTHRSSSITGGTAYAGLTFDFKPAPNGDRYWRVSATSAHTSTATVSSTAASLTYTIEYLA